MSIDVTEATFATEVLDRSRTVPVVVDFWAAWCGPCRQLGPVIEDAVAARRGSVVLAKVDVDASPRIASALGIRGIPAVKAFRDGAIVSEFVGAVPRAQVESFLDALVEAPPAPPAGPAGEDELRAAVAADPTAPAPRLALARVLIERGDREAAADLLRPVEHDPAAAGALARLALAEIPDAPAAASAALGALDSGDSAAALDALVAAVRESHGEPRELARRLAVGIFAELGDSDPLTTAYRPRLASALH